ncbi:N-6 DNA methylase [Aliarcobacter butzleri]|uniref:N-6 DNA methylase n=1 Tax=Aliarcobacter butzleri TaxID=28197 RepID=UPI003AF685DA
MELFNSGNFSNSNFFIPLINKVKLTLFIKNKKFIIIDDLLKLLNSEDNKRITKSEIISEILEYSNDFYYINGLIIDTQENTFQEIKKYHSYIKNLLTPYFNKPDIQYIVSFLFFYKRFNDYNNPQLNDIKLTTFMIEGTRKDLLIDNIKRFNSLYHFGINLTSDFINYIKNIKIEIIEEIFYILEKLDTKKYNEIEFGKIFEYLIDKDTESNFTNKSMQQLMLKFFELKDDATILNPFGGLGGLIIESIQNNSNIHIEYTEINNKTLQLGVMCIYMYGKFKIKFNCEDSFLSYTNNIKYDYLITELPLARIFTQSELNSNIIKNIQNNSPVGDIKSKESILYYLIYTLSKVNSNGKAIFNVPAGFLFNSSSDYIKVRKYLIENDLIETIINLPSGTMYHSAINTSLLLINFNKNEKNKIKIINAKLLYESKSRNREIINESILDIDTILDSYNHETKDSFLIDIDKISKKDYRLDTSIFQKEIFELHYDLEEGKAKYLKDLVTIKKGKNFDRHKLSNNGEFPIVKIQNLHNDVLDLYINENDTFEMLQNIQSGDIISEECILIASVGEQLKPTIFKPSHKLPNIFITTNIIVLIPRDDVSIEYLYYQMYSKIVTEQIKNLTSGSIRTFLTIKSVSELIIPYVELQEQKNFTNTQKTNIIVTQRAELETKLKLIGYKEEIESKESDIVRTLTHQLRATLSTINMEVDILKTIISSHNIGNLTNKDLSIPEDDDFEKPINYTLDDISNKIKTNSKKLHNNLETVDKVMRFKLENKDFSHDDLYDFFVKYIESKKTENGNNFNINLKGKSVYADFNKESFIELLDQLISNAKRHAFKENSTDYKIDFNIRKNILKEILTIEYFNNGKKFNVSKEDYIGAFKKGQSSDGTGIGGNFIYRIIKAHNGELFIDEINEIGFRFKIEIPLKYKGEIDE